jgi:pilus assembly protein CpaB
MRITSLLTLAAGLAVAGGSAWMARDYLEKRYALAQAMACSNDLVQVVVAAQDIPFGLPVEAAKLKVINWPASALPPGAFTQTKDLLAASGAEPRRAKAGIAAGEILLASKVSGFGEKVTIVQSLSPNTRAIAIKVSAETSVGGFVTPGDRVDVILTQGKGDGLKTVTIIQKVRVIGVDQKADEAKDAPVVARTVTLEVSPEDSQKLALAQKAGTLSLTLRTLEDEAEQSLEAISLRDVLREPEVAAAEEVSVRTVIVRRGTEATEDELR